jgi:alkylhydroperoxidase family enzyme
MQPRTKNPFLLLSDALQALVAVNKSAENAGTLRNAHAVHVRASQINGCSVGGDIHLRELKKTRSRPGATRFTSPERKVRTRIERGCNTP